MTANTTAAWPRRCLLTALLTAFLLAAGGTAAAADAAGPTNYRSEVTGLEPSAEGVTARVYGGDAFLELIVEPGREVVVPGYDDDPEAAPYLRVDAEGNVFVNRRSPAAYLNAARYGSRDVSPPAGADAMAPPDWEQVATGGRYAWHDHRIHWMSPSVPPQVDQQAAEAQRVLEWEVPLVVDGRKTAITGTLTWLASRNPAAPLLVGLLCLGGAALAVRGRRLLTLVVVGVAGVVALGLGLTEALSAPPGAEADLLRVVLPGLGLAAALLALALRGRGERSAVLLAVLGAVPLVVWVVLQLGALTAPVLAGGAADPLVRFGSAAVLGAALGALTAGGASLVEPLEEPDEAGPDDRPRDGGPSAPS